MADPHNNRVLTHTFSAQRPTTPYPNRGNMTYSHINDSVADSAVRCGGTLTATSTETTPDTRSLAATAAR